MKKNSFLFVFFVVITLQLHSQNTNNQTIMIEIKYCDNTIDTVYYPIDIVDNPVIPSFKKSENGVIDFIDFIVKDCEQIPILPKYDEYNNRIDESSPEYIEYISKTKNTISIEYLSNDTLIANVRQSHNCNRSFVGKIRFIPEESLIQLSSTAFGNYGTCYCMYSFVFIFVFSEAKNSIIDFHICEQ